MNLPAQRLFFPHHSSEAVTHACAPCCKSETQSVRESYVSFESPISRGLRKFSESIARHCGEEICEKKNRPAAAAATAERDSLSTLFFRPSDPESLVKRDPVRRKRKVPWWTDGRTDGRLILTHPLVTTSHSLPQFHCRYILIRQPVR